VAAEAAQAAGNAAAAATCYREQTIGLIKLQQHDQALVASDKAMEADNTCWESWDARGLVLLLGGRHEEAVGSLEKAFDRNPPVDGMLADQLQANRHNVKAAQLVRAQQQQLPAEQRKVQGSVAFKAKDFNTAIKLYEAALAAAEPGKLASEGYLKVFCATVRSNLALCQNGLQNWAAAAEHAQAALSLVPASHKIAVKAQRTLDFALTKEHGAEQGGADH